MIITVPIDSERAAKKKARLSRRRANKAARKKAKKLGIQPPARVVLLKPSASADFYSSREWRELRYQALVTNGACCQCCGRSRQHGIVLHVDHIKPRSKFPGLELTLSNLQVLCEDCNMGKSNKDQTDWRPKQPTIYQDGTAKVYRIK